MKEQFLPLLIPELITLTLPTLELQVNEQGLLP